MSPLSLPQLSSVFPLRLPSVPPSYISSLPSQSHHGCPLSMPPLQSPFSVFPQSPLSFHSQSCRDDLSQCPPQSVPSQSPPAVSPLNPTVDVPSQHPLPSCALMPSEQPHIRVSAPSELTHSQTPASNPASLYKHFLLCLDRLPQPKTGLEDRSSHTSMDFHTGSQPENQVV